MKTPQKDGKIEETSGKGANIKYEIGQQVLYGIHGVCAVTAVDAMRFGKTKANYYILEPLTQPGLKFYVPVENAAAVAKLWLVVLA